MDSDISELRKGAFHVSVPWSVAGNFARVKDTKLWVYCHPGHVNASDALYQNFSNCVNVVETPPCISTCKSNHCEVLQPFFCDNEVLEQTWTDVGMMDLVDELKETTRADPALDSGMFASQGCTAASGFEYNKNTWTKRLMGSLQRHLPNHQVKYTAQCAMEFATYQSTLSLLGTSRKVLMCYPFQGCNDSTINRTQVLVEVSRYDDNSPHHLRSPPHSSGDETTIECGKQADRLAPYPPKLGELTARIYISVIQKCCRMFLKNKPMKEEINGSGIYINKQSAPCIVQLTMPIVCVGRQCPNHLPSVKLSISKPVVGLLNPQRLCSAIEQLVECTPYFITY